MRQAGKQRPEGGACSATALRKASRRVTQLYDDALEPSGLRSTQFAVLSELDRGSAKPPTMADLARALVIERSALGHNLKPLERDGFITLQGGEEDRRRRHVKLTPLGRAKLAEASPLWRSAQTRFDAVFGKAASRDLRATLLAIAHDERLATLTD